MNDLEKTDNVNYKPLEEAKKIAINTLSNAFSSNNITLEKLENSITVIENAKSIEDFKKIYSELNLDMNELISKRTKNINELEKISLHGSTKKIESIGLITKKIEIDTAHGKIVLDYSNIHLPEGEYELAFNAIHSVCIILLADEIKIDNKMNEVYSKVKDKRKITSENNNITIRLTGNLIHSEIKIKRERKKGKEI